MDVFIEKIFRNKIFNKEKLLNYGFKLQNNNLVYVTELMDRQFKLILTVYGVKNIEALMVDSFSNDLYTLHLVESATGTFIGKLRELYEKILSNIAYNCCNETLFLSTQANRITKLINDTYHDEPEFLWDKFPGYGVFRNPESKKWYAVILNIDKSKLDNKSCGCVEILNLKSDKKDVILLQQCPGFYPAYHMNKKYWITVLLDETVNDAKIMELIEKSHSFSKYKK